MPPFVFYRARLRIQHHGGLPAQHGGKVPERESARETSTASRFRLSGNINIGCWLEEVNGKWE